MRQHLAGAIQFPGIHGFPGLGNRQVEAFGPHPAILFASLQFDAAAQLRHGRVVGLQLVQFVEHCRGLGESPGSQVLRCQPHGPVPSLILLPPADNSPHARESRMASVWSGSMASARLSRSSASSNSPFCCLTRASSTSRFAWIEPSSLALASASRICSTTLVVSSRAAASRFLHRLGEVPLGHLLLGRGHPCRYPLPVDLFVELLVDGFQQLSRLPVSRLQLLRLADLRPRLLQIARGQQPRDVPQNRRRFLLLQVHQHRGTVEAHLLEGLVAKFPLLGESPLHHQFQRLRTRRHQPAQGGGIVVEDCHAQRAQIAHVRFERVLSREQLVVHVAERENIGLLAGLSVGVNCSGAM